MAEASEKALSEQQAFIQNIPPKTPVWQDAGKVNFGVTVGDIRIYIDPNNPTVLVTDVNGSVGVIGVWSTNQVIKMEM